MRAYKHGFNLHKESALYTVWFGCNQQKLFLHLSQASQNITTTCINCSTEAAALKKGIAAIATLVFFPLFLHQLQLLYMIHGGRMERKTTKRGKKFNISVK